MKKLIIFSAALAALVSCNKSIIEMPVASDEKGYIVLDVATSDVMVETKALAANASLDGYNITLINKTTSAKWTKEYGEAVADASLWKVDPGTYTIKVENKSENEVYPDNSSAGNIRIYGETDVPVTAGRSSTCTVSCSPVNGKISFYGTDNFLSIFTDPTVTVTDNTRTASLGTVSNTSENAAFFNPCTVTWTLTAEVESVEKTYTGDVTITAAHWSKVTFDVSSTNGVINVTISVNDTMTESDVDAPVDPLK
ncbi:MAG: DUF4493 domain-containing protein [Candidatus Cryptobacteroides sp.]